MLERVREARAGCTRRQGTGLDHEVASVQRVEPGRAVEAQVVPVDSGVRELDLREGRNGNTVHSKAVGTDVDDGVALVGGVIVKPVVAVGQVVDLGPGRGA